MNLQLTTGLMITVLAYFLFDEKPTKWQYSGMALILIATSILGFGNEAYQTDS